MQATEQIESSVLFVNKNEDETAFLTRGLTVKVVQTSLLATAKEELKNHPFKSIFVDIASALPSDILDIKARCSQHNVPVFVLAHASEVAIAVQYVKQGAQGFLVKGLSDSDSLLKLMEYATSKS